MLIEEQLFKSAIVMYLLAYVKASVSLDQSWSLILPRVITANTLISWLGGDGIDWAPL